MYSSLYHYYEIRGDEKYTKFCESSKLTSFMEYYFKKVEIEKDNIKVHFDGQISIGILVADEFGNYHSGEKMPSDFNLLSIVVSKKFLNINEVTESLVDIAKELNWFLIHEEDEHGDRDIILYSPSGVRI